MNNSVSILVTGDTHLGSGRVKDLALSNESKKIFGSFLNEIQQADISITNLETPLIDNGNPIAKTGPNLKSPIKTLRVLKNAGFNLLTLANNHIMDYGEEGLRLTIEACVRSEIETVGAGYSLDEAREPHIREINGIRVSVINIAENEFGTTNGDAAGAHPLNPIQNYYSIVEARNSSDYVLVIVHGGHERYSLPSPRMKKTYRFFIDVGVDAVIGHHPHCYSGYEMYRGSPIFYSVGNLLFDKGSQPPDDWNSGYMVKFTIRAKSLDFELLPYIQNAKEPGIREFKEEEYELFEKKIFRLNKIISDDDMLKKSFDDFVEYSKKLYTSYLEPHEFKYIHALRNRNLFPSLLTDRKKRLLLNLTRCEAHRDVLLKILQK